jgi:aspartate racemase
MSSKIGVIGGMGPEASCVFYEKIIKYSQEKYGAVQDTDYPELILHSLPLEGFNEIGIEDKEKVFSQLKESVRNLNKMKVSFIVMTCNTVHYFVNKLQKISSVPILSIIDLVNEKVNGEKTLLLASESVYKLGVYSHVKNIAIPSDDDKKIITNCILSVMNGKKDFSSKEKLLSLINKSDFSKVILGCTELPLIIGSKDTDKKLIDTLDLLAIETLKKYHSLSL